MILPSGKEDILMPYLSRTFLSYTGSVGVLDIIVISEGFLPLIICIAMIAAVSAALVLSYTIPPTTPVPVMSYGRQKTGAAQ